MNPLRVATAISDSLLSLLYPQNCGSCAGAVESHELGSTCRACWASTRLFVGEETLCNKCGAFLNASPSQNAAACGRCDAHAYDIARAAGVYAGGLRDAVLKLKSEPWVPPRLKREMIAAFERSGFAGADIVVPVPLSRKRAVERGYNQAAVIAAILSRSARIELGTSALERRLDTPMHRVGMDQKARELTVKKAFAVVHPRLIEARDVVLVDDVFTSGATASACAAVLKKNGAARVRVFTVARAVLGK